MCTSPILIKNRRIPYLNVKVRNSFIKVPCGHCDECLRKRAKDLYVRSRFQFENDLLNGGSGFMCCLTYGLDKAPVFEHNRERYYVFNKKHVIDFIKRLRTNLDRFYKKHYNTDAPDFKYLVTSEYGSSEKGFHLPHYHLIFSFAKYISLYTFQECYKRSVLCDCSPFGYIYQCDALDIKLGGIKYTSKYILKDTKFAHCDKIINEHIKFYSDYVSKKHGIIENPSDCEEVFRNKCIRSSKSYKRDINTYVTPFRHMLQFYMCSNDYGCSSILSHYGESLYSLGLLNIDGFPYSIPKQVKQRLERTQGSHKRYVIDKAVFLESFQRCLDDVVSRNLFPSSCYDNMLSFVKDYVQPRYGSLYLVSPLHDNSYLCGSPLHYYNDVLSDSFLYSDNDMYRLRDEVCKIIEMSNCPDNLRYRQYMAYNKSMKEKHDYEQRKRNKGL